MKNSITKTCIIFTLLTLSFSNSKAFAQIPQAINFQAIARDNNGNPMENTNLQIRLSVVDSAQSGTIIYQELRALQTNAYGSFSFQIGLNPDFITIGTFQNINWSTGNKHLKIDYDPSNTFTFNLTLGVIKFVTVPFAFATEKVVYIDESGAQNGDVLKFNTSSGKFVPTQISTNWNDIQNKPNFSTVSMSGAYNDLTNSPNISDSISNKAVLLSGDQTITGNKSFNGTVTSTSFVKIGGTSSQFLKADGSVDNTNYSTTVREVNDEYSAIASQTTFTLTQIPSANSKVKLFVNGIRISNNAYTYSGTTFTYIPLNNGSYFLSDGDRIQIEYYYY